MAKHKKRFRNKTILSYH